ncbi:trehalase-like isoform X1 [Canis lupus baileyi]|uniref:trehalase-like isoform X1 n=2 Tax=Canis lupus dingo TaxID=286419 RepID=UPI0020C237CA|nr:trehalase-like isoform X1 [Canis lupus dingo]
MIVACGQHSLLDSFSLSEAQRGQWCAQGCTASVLLASPRAVTPVAQSGALGSSLPSPTGTNPGSVLLPPPPNNRADPSLTETTLTGTEPRGNEQRKYLAEAPSKPHILVLQLFSQGHNQVKPEVLSHPEQFSLIYAAHPFIVPGGRFTEFYYWDSYWVMEGLLLSEMPGTVKGMLQNFLELVRIYGHVPNGARVYYLQRSQPPLLTLMMDRYVSHTNDTAFLRDSIGTLALELDFWTQNRIVSVSSGGKSYVLNHYAVPYGGPRDPWVAQQFSTCLWPRA